MADRKPIKSAYSILRVEQSATSEEIRAAYLALVKVYHPDKSHGDKLTEERFKRINWAFDILKDPKKRGFYDERLDPRVLSRLRLSGPRRTHHAIWLTGAALAACGVAFIIHVGEPQPKSANAAVDSMQTARELPSSDAPPRTMKNPIARLSFPEVAPPAQTIQPPFQNVLLQPLEPQSTYVEPYTAPLPLAQTPKAPPQTKAPRPAVKVKAAIPGQTLPDRAKTLNRPATKRVAQQTVTEEAVSPVSVKVSPPARSHVSEVLTGGF